jgi:hypothetical protein
MSQPKPDEFTEDTPVDDTTDGTPFPGAEAPEEDK